MRTGRNPRTGKATEIPAQRAMRFSPGRALKESVNRFTVDRQPVTKTTDDYGTFVAGKRPILCQYGR
ncbi:MAG: hypothetical protein GY731_11510 [Gammaproteobacteria bacterium]|nr:hypothetical protein [Gammaproteobacteria bacterium]